MKHFSIFVVVLLFIAGLFLSTLLFSAGIELQLPFLALVIFEALVYIIAIKVICGALSFAYLIQGIPVILIVRFILSIFNGLVFFVLAGRVLTFLDAYLAALFYYQPTYILQVIFVPVLAYPVLSSFREAKRERKRILPPTPEKVKLSFTIPKVKPTTTRQAEAPPEISIPAGLPDEFRELLEKVKKVEQKVKPTISVQIPVEEKEAPPISAPVPPPKIEEKPSIPPPPVREKPPPAPEPSPAPPKPEPAPSPIVSPAEIVGPTKSVKVSIREIIEANKGEPGAVILERIIRRGIDFRIEIPFHLVGEQLATGSVSLSLEQIYNFIPLEFLELGRERQQEDFSKLTVELPLNEIIAQIPEDFFAEPIPKEVVSWVTESEKMEAPALFKETGKAKEEPEIPVPVPKVEEVLPPVIEPPVEEVAEAGAETVELELPAPAEEEEPEEPEEGISFEIEPEPSPIPEEITLELEGLGFPQEAEEESFSFSQFEVAEEEAPPAEESIEKPPPEEKASAGGPMAEAPTVEEELPAVGEEIVAEEGMPGEGILIEETKESKARGPLPVDLELSPKPLYKHLPPTAFISPAGGLFLLLAPETLAAEKLVRPLDSFARAGISRITGRSGEALCESLFFSQKTAYGALTLIVPKLLRLEFLRFNKEEQVEELKSLAGVQDGLRALQGASGEFILEGVFEDGLFKAEHKGIRFILRRKPEEITDLKALLEGIVSLRDLLPIPPLSFPIELLLRHPQANLVLFCSADEVTLVEIKPGEVSAVVFAEAKRLLEGVSR